MAIRWRYILFFSHEENPISLIIKLNFSVLTSTSPGDMFIWMPKEHLYVLVYLVTVMHSMQGGYMDKAQKYTDKAFTQIEKLKSEFKNHIINTYLF